MGRGIEQGVCVCKGSEALFALRARLGVCELLHHPARRWDLSFSSCSADNVIRCKESYQAPCKAQRAVLTQ